MGTSLDGGRKPHTGTVVRADMLPTPCYVVDEGQLKKNLEILAQVQRDTGCKILLAQKAFSMFSEYPLIGKYLTGTTASGLYEARLGAEEMGGEVHVFAPAYRDVDMLELLSICDHITFNSISQLEKYRHLCGNVSVGLRINPRCSTQEHAIYDPCATGSRLGVTSDKLSPEIMNGVDGLHFHTLCEQNADALEITLNSVEEQFGKYFKNIKWLNMGGGHHITRSDYDIELLERCILRVKDNYGLEVYLEPGEAIALNAGYLITEILDIVENDGITTLILDASAACHMPDVLEMPYRPPLKDSGKPGKLKYTYRLSSYTCLAGDIIGDYSFNEELRVGDRLCFEDMAIYTMVKNNTFNGIPLPSIAVMGDDGDCHIVKSFGYEDFKERLS